ncbi:MAG: hypothetical protein V4621_04525 [Pseudomonadota bacterium]
MPHALPLHIQLKRKMQLYSVLSTFFMINGLFIFLDLYLEHIEGHFWSAMRNPSAYGIFIFPFLPGLLLSFIAYKINGKYKAAAVGKAK